MKKRYLVAAVLLSFLLALLQAGNILHERGEPNISMYQQKNISISSLKYPHTELEINSYCWSNAIVYSKRVQEGAGALPFCGFESFRQSKTYGCNIVGNSNLSFKEYLAHIYPTHNFW